MLHRLSFGDFPQPSRTVIGLCYEHPDAANRPAVASYQVDHALVAKRWPPGPGIVGGCDIPEVELGPQGPLMVVGRLGSQVIGDLLVGAEIGKPQTECRLPAQIRGRFHGSPPVVYGDEHDRIAMPPQLYEGKTAISKETNGPYLGLATSCCPARASVLVPIVRRRHGYGLGTRRQAS
jgi:hypothetical protein